MTILETEQLVKIYKTKEGLIHALDGIDLQIPNGATALLGPNGSGKSTLIKIVLGLIKSTSGSYNINVDRVGYMPETPSIISKVNAVKFVRHFGILSGLSFTRAMQRAHEVLDYVGLDEARYREIEKYSTGMKQRLLFGQALVHDPDLLILDEPTSGLSPEGRSEMLYLINEINKDYGKSILFSTHILPDVEDICNFSVLVNRGKSLFQGSMDDVARLYPKSVILEVLGDIDTGVGTLQSKGYETERYGRSIRIYPDDNTDVTFGEISEVFSEKGIKLVSMKQQQPNLEDLFLKSIQKDIDQFEEVET